MYVGLGAAKVRNLFIRARKSAPCIVYIDEIDAVGRKRSPAGSMGGGSDERDQTLNQLLVEMDGMAANQGIIVLASTNREDILDNALIRPGRFDRKITVHLPNQDERTQIFHVHMASRPCVDTIRVDDLSRLTSGFSGADISNLCNEAAICAARENEAQIQMQHFEKAFDRIVLGTRRGAMTDRQRWITSVHEIGHVLSSLYLTVVYDKLHKVSIESRGQAGGVTVFLPNEENQMYITKQYVMESILVALGGHAAEEVIFGPKMITSGAQRDFEVATSTARTMISKFGFSDVVGKVSWEIDNVSDAHQHMIDETVRTMISSQYDICVELMQKYRTLLHHLANELMLHNTLSADQISFIMKDFKEK
jgi:cell division protease FtsH